MTREHVLMILGVLVAISPWSGLPFNWLAFILPVLGLAVLGVTITMRKRSEPVAPYVPPSAPPTIESRELHPEPHPRSSHIAFS